MLEKAVKASLREYLKKIGAYQYWPVPMGMGAATIDCFFCYRGRFFAVETKRPGIDKATPRQDRVLEHVAQCGGGTCVENDPALPTVKRMIQEAL